MRRLFILAAACVAAVNLAGCAGFSGAVSGPNLTQILTDPRCAHDDELEGITGAAGVPASLHFKVARHCPAAEPQVLPLKDIDKLAPDAGSGGGNAAVDPPPMIVGLNGPFDPG
jgi:hypothetical protein